MDRVAVFVDAGYLFAQGSVVLAGEKLARGRVRLNADAVAKFLAAFAVQVSSLPLLRIYWYDGTSAGPTSQHTELAFLPGMKVRLGFVNSVGEQKGVDSLIVTDMIALARNRAIAEAVLITGDEDLRVGVQQAQEHGVRVHVVGLKPARGSQSIFLLQEADATYEWGVDEIKNFLSLAPTAQPINGTATTIAAVGATTPPASPIAAVIAQTTVVVATSESEAADPTIEAAIRGVAAEVASLVLDDQLESLITLVEASGSVPKEYHGKLLGKCRGAIGRQLNSQEKRDATRLFIQACKDRAAKT
jgi:hypothetical protein